MTPAKRNRRSIRLKNYDYSQSGAYFVTICTQNHICLFGDIVEGEMILNDLGRIVQEEWIKTEQLRPNVSCGKFVVMPNHIHFIMQNVGADLRVCPDITTGECRQGEHIGSPLHRVVQWFKTLTTKRYIDGVKNDDWPRFNGKLWQRNYWEHIVRNENEYNHIAQYIMDNPKKWALDKLNVGAGLCVCPNTIREPSAIYNDEVWMV